MRVKSLISSDTESLLRIWAEDRQLKRLRTGMQGDIRHSKEAV